MRKRLIDLLFILTIVALLMPLLLAHAGNLK
jgi:hypothetical protein